MPKILIFGDIFGRLGRKALASVLPELRNEFKFNLVLANVENLAHGKGVTETTLQQLSDLGVDVFTSGNHVFDKQKEAEDCFPKFPQMIRPANYSDNLPGKGWYRFEKNGQWYVVINLGGQVFFENQYKAEIRNPFHEADKILQSAVQDGDIILVDFHAEATSEKIALGWHLDGRATIVYGTHTHVPTADAKILPGGTAYVTDVGMTGAVNSVIGVKKENAMRVFLEGEKFKMEPEEEGASTINAVLVTIEKGRVTAIERICREV